MNNLLIDMLKRHEGFRSKPYRCSAGKLTIAYGRNLEDVGITKAEALMLLYTDVETAIASLENIFSDLHKFSTNRQNALISMIFNLGASRFRLFKKMIQAIKDSDWKEASRQAKDSKWHCQVGARAEEIETLLVRG